MKETIGSSLAPNKWKIEKKKTSFSSLENDVCPSYFASV